MYIRFYQSIIYIVRYFFALQLRSNPNFYSKQTYSLLRFQKAYTNGKILSTRSYFAHCDGSKEKRDEHKHSFLTKYYLKLDERFNEGFTNKPAKHFKCIRKKESPELWHIQIDTLARYGCILLIVSVQSSLRIQKQIPEEKP